MPLHPTLNKVLDRINERSQASRQDYETRMRNAVRPGPARSTLSCSNVAHVFAAAESDKFKLKVEPVPNIGIVTAFNDMLSAHQPLETYPGIIKQSARLHGAVAQVAGGVPAMCDGVTQGTPGMELSLFSRDVIALSTAVALSHAAFDATLLLGVCDKIVPGLFIGAASFGHLPTLFVPAGPMTSGIANAEKAAVRQRYAEGKATRAELLEVESASYHDAGTCTFYGTANTNQMVMEMMGLHLPGTAFVNPGTPLRLALTQATARIAAHTHLGNHYVPFYEVATAKSFINALVGLMATGGSTNHTIHVIAMAKAVGLVIDWQDMADLSAVTPLLARVYPNGSADVNHFHAAGGMAFITQQLLGAGLLFGDVKTALGLPYTEYTKEPYLQDGKLAWREVPNESQDTSVLRGVDNPFLHHGGMALLKGNVGRAVVKTSAVKPEYCKITAPAKVFHTQAALENAFKAGQLEQDFVAVLAYQGPKAIGMPELHKLTPALGALQDRGFRVALVTDGRMSGASGKVLAAIHLSPEALDGGMIARIQDGDMIHIDADQGLLEVHVPEAELMARTPNQHELASYHSGTGRELFDVFRARVGSAETGASSLL